MYNIIIHVHTLFISINSEAVCCSSDVSIDLIDVLIQYDYLKAKVNQKLCTGILMCVCVYVLCVFVCMRVHYVSVCMTLYIVCVYICMTLYIVCVYICMTLYNVCVYICMTLYIVCVLGNLSLILCKHSLSPAFLTKKGCQKTGKAGNDIRMCVCM